MTDINTDTKQQTKQQQTMSKHLPMITVETLPNGYSLKFEGSKRPNGHLYFSPRKLLEGFMMHIGLKLTEELNTETMKDFLTTAMNWKDNEACVKEIERLNTEMALLERKRTGMARRLVEERNQHIALTLAFASLFEGPDALPIDSERKAKIGTMLKPHKRLVPYTLSKLGIESPDIIPDEEETDDENQ